MVCRYLLYKNFIGRRQTERENFIDYFFHGGCSGLEREKHQDKGMNRYLHRAKIACYLSVRRAESLPKILAIVRGGAAFYLGCMITILLPSFTTHHFCFLSSLPLFLCFSFYLFFAFVLYSFSSCDAMGSWSFWSTLQSSAACFSSCFSPCFAFPCKSRSRYQKDPRNHKTHFHMTLKEWKRNGFCKVWMRLTYSLFFSLLCILSALGGIPTRIRSMVVVVLVLHVFHWEKLIWWLLDPPRNFPVESFY